MSELKTLYEAANAVEAQMLVDLLKQRGLTAHVHGANLTGAMGDLPLTGLVRLVIATEDHARARDVIDTWETTQPAQTPVESKAASRLSGLHFMGLGILVGAAFGYAFFRRHGNNEVSETDSDGNGIPDVRLNYVNGVLATEEDILATSGRAFRVERFKLGVRISVDVDTDLDGRLDTHIVNSPLGVEERRSAIRQ